MRLAMAQMSLNKNIGDNLRKTIDYMKSLLKKCQIWFCFPRFSCHLFSLSIIITTRQNT